METNLNKILTWGVALSAALFLGAIIYFFLLQTVPEGVDFIALQQSRFEVLKAIGIGFLITLLGLVVPHLLATAKYNFEMEKEGRQLYSEAKTGIEYLPFELPGMPYEKAIAHVKKIHQMKHMADLYSNPLSLGVKYSESFSNYQAFERIEVARDTLIDQDNYMGKNFDEQLKYFEKIFLPFKPKKKNPQP